MKIAYYVHLNLGQNTGVFKKIINQAKTWTEYGHEVKLFILTRENDVIESFRKYMRQFDISINQYHDLVKLLPIDKLRKLDDLINSIIKYSPDVIYTRRDLFYPNIKKLSKRIPVIIEINGNELSEFLLYSKINYLYHMITRRHYDKNIAGFVFVTDELAQDRYFRFIKARKIVIGNGIDLTEYNVLPYRGSDRPTLIFLGDGYIWQGIDKMQKLAEIFKEWKIILVGDIKTNKKTQNMNFIVLPKMNKDKYISLLASSDVAIGSLALHRKNMNEGSVLKTREYLAFGLPVIAAYKDVDIPDEAEYFLQLPNVEDNIVPFAEEIRSFVNRWRGKRVEKDQIKGLDSSYKEKKRLEFFAEIVKAFNKYYNAR